MSALTRVAEPECEEQLLELAEALTAPQLERAVGAYRRLTREQAAGQQAREFLDWFWEEDASLSFRGRLPAEEGALLLRALEAGREALRARRLAEADEAAEGAEEVEDVGEVAPEPSAEEGRVSNAEALVAVADLALAGSGADRNGGERYQVVVRVDAHTLISNADGRCELEDGHPLAAETARRLSCDASLVELRERDGETLARTQAEDRLAAAAACAARPRPRLPLPRLREHALRRRPPRSRSAAATTGSSTSTATRSSCLRTARSGSETGTESSSRACRARRRAPTRTLFPPGTAISGSGPQRPGPEHDPATKIACRPRDRGHALGSRVQRTLPGSTPGSIRLRLDGSRTIRARPRSCAMAADCASIR